MLTMLSLGLGDTAMVEIEKEILAWAARELKYWEQSALHIVSNAGNASSNDLDELEIYFLEDAGLSPVREGRRKISVLDNALDEPDISPIRLTKVFNVRNVNALPLGQTMHFGPQLTIVYGANGAGKSGYVRILGAAGFARGNRSVLPNVSARLTPQTPQADIEVSGDGTTRVVSWAEGRRQAELSRFHVFDGESLTAHLAGSNSVSFTPGGLWVLTALAEVTDLVRDRIRKLIESREEPRTFEPIFEGSSKTKDEIAKIDGTSDIKQLQRLALLTDDEKQRLRELETQIIELKLVDIGRQIHKRSEEAGDLRAFAMRLRAAEAALNEAVEVEVGSLVSSVVRWHDTVERSGASQFRSEVIKHTGTTVWQEFVAAARALADVEFGPENWYPSENSKCLLCQQTLSDSAIELLRRLWNFQTSDSQVQLQVAESACDLKLANLGAINLDYFREDSNVRRILNEELQNSVPAVDAQVGSCRERRNELQSALRSRKQCPAPPLIRFDLTEVEHLASLREREVQELRRSDVGQRLAEAEREYLDLKHRLTLGSYLPDIEAYIDRRRWALKARQALGSTRTITTKYNELFERLVTDHYKKVFEGNLRRFGKESKVVIGMRGFKGETLREITLDPRSFQPGFPVTKVLSEGEQRAVAMADFLTETALDKHNCGIILDDPVTSMDDSWKEVLAESLAELSRSRQVIVFTHDLAFVYKMKEGADRLQVDIQTHWVRDENGQPGLVFLDNSPACEKDYKSVERAKRWYSKAKDAPPEEQEAYLQQGFGALRTSYEALIIYEIFAEVVKRFDERIIFGALKKVRVDPVLSEEIVRRMEFLSRFIVAHSHSDRFSAKPTPALLSEEIAHFEAIRQAQRDLMKKAPPQTAATIAGTPSQVAGSDRKSGSDLDESPNTSAPSSSN